MVGVIGNFQTAYDVITIEGVSINWVIISHWLAMAGIIWLAFVNWDFFLRRKREALKKNLIPLSEVVGIINGGYAKGLTDQHVQVLDLVKEAARIGRIDVYGTNWAHLNIQKITRDFWDESGVFKIEIISRDLAKISVHQSSYGAPVHEVVMIKRSKIKNIRTFMKNIEDLENNLIESGQAQGVSLQKVSKRLCPR